MAKVTQATICRGLKAMRQCATVGLGCVGYHSFPLFLLPQPHDTSNKNTSDIKSPYSRRAGIISFSIVNITTVIHEYHCFLHHFKWQMKTRRTTNVNFHQRYLHKVFKNRRIFLSHFYKEIKPTQEHQARTYIHTDQQSNVNEKKKDIITCCFSFSFCYHSHNAYLNPDWEKSHWFSPDA